MSFRVRDIVCLCIMFICGITAIVMSLFGESNDKCFFASQVLVCIGMLVTSMELYFRKDDTTKMICKSIIYMIVLGILIFIFREKLAKLNVVITIIIFNLIASLINAFDRIVLKARK